MTAATISADVILVGGGLANTLIALALRSARPDLTLIVLERAPMIGAGHTWSFHTTDVTARQYAVLAPLIVARWPRQEVRFAGYSRVIETGYNTVSSERLHQVTLDALGPAIRLGAQVSDVTPATVTLADGTRLSAPLVIDGRGALQNQPLALGYQKFVGLEVETSAPHGQAHPITMDATVAQLDGYRFVYTLPLSTTRILIEDTYYSDTAALDHGTIEMRVHAYAAVRGWSIATVVRKECGVLPIALAGDLDAHWRALGNMLPRSGLRSWLFHATTGYSLPNAVQLAQIIAQAPALNSGAIAALIEQHARAHWQSQSLFRLLNRCLFLAADPPARVRILEQFYRSPRSVIEHFYAGRLGYADRAMLVAIMAARPPVGVRRALSCIDDAAAWTFANRNAGAPADLG